RERPLESLVGHSLHAELALRDAEPAVDRRLVVELLQMLRQQRRRTRPVLLLSEGEHTREEALEVHHAEPAAGAGSRTRLRPVISGGCSSSMKPRTVGATSASRPSLRSGRASPCGSNTRKSTGSVVCAV